MKENERDWTRPFEAEIQRWLREVIQEREKDIEAKKPIDQALIRSRPSGDARKGATGELAEGFALRRQRAAETFQTLVGNAMTVLRQNGYTEKILDILSLVRRAQEDNALEQIKDICGWIPKEKREEFEQLLEKYGIKEKATDEHQ